MRYIIKWKYVDFTHVLVLGAIRGLPSKSRLTTSDLHTMHNKADKKMKHKQALIFSCICILSINIAFQRPLRCLSYKRGTK